MYGELVKEIQNVTQEVLENKKAAGKISCPFVCLFFYFSVSASFIARTFNGRPNKLINPSASWWS